MKMPVKAPAVTYSKPMLCDKPLVKRPIAATIVATIAKMRQPNFVIRYDPMGQIQHNNPD